MIFLSAQPDAPYFIWQIELQLFNLCQKGWPQENIHTLISYNPNIGPSLQVYSLIKRFPNCKIFLYPDTRKSKKYASTIRPHIIEKHFQSFPSLRKEAIFYIDCDVIFREIPDFSSLLNDDAWYASDTKSYMSCKIIIATLGYDVFSEMCKIVKISPELVMEKEENTGGAQYIIKNIPTWFWPKVEKDSNNLYDYLYNLLYADTDHNFFERQSLDIWITEMWVVCWNAILAGTPFIVHPMLDFCWANQSKEQWNETYILHYTGGGQGNFFKKTDFVLNPPFYSDLSFISNDFSSAPLKDLIESYRLCLEKDKILMNDLTLVIPINTVHQHSIDNLGYLLKHINTNVIVIEIGEAAKINPSSLPDSVRYMYNTKMELNTLDIATDYIGVIPSNCIVPIIQIIEAIDKLRKNQARVIYPFNIQFKVDVLTMHIFSKILDDEFLLSNTGKLFPANKTLEVCPVFIKNGIQYDHQTPASHGKGCLFFSKY